MWKRRIAWILLLIASATLYLFENDSPALALLAVLILLPVMSWALLKLSGRHLMITLANEENMNAGAGEGNEEHTVSLTVSNPDLLPVPDAVVTVRCTNLRTGETDTYEIRTSVFTRRTIQKKFNIKPCHAGRYEISADTVTLYDPLHLFSRKVWPASRVFITSPPRLFPLPMTVTSSAAAMLESDRDMAAWRRGNDPGEVRSIRDYVPGDPVKNIHWKLSDKTDKMLVKELGLTVTDQFLLILDTAADIGLNPEALDAIASVFASIATSLCMEDFDFSIGWTDPASGLPVFRKVANEADLIAATDDYLSVPATTRSAFEIIERGITGYRFAHLIMVGSQVPAGIDAISNGCQVSLLLYGAERSRTSDGANIVGFDEHNYDSELGGIEI